MGLLQISFEKPIGLSMGYEGIEHAFKNLNIKTIIGLVLCENDKVVDSMKNWVFKSR